MSVIWPTAKNGKPNSANTMRVMPTTTGRITRKEYDENDQNHYRKMELTGKIIAVMPANSGQSQRTGQTWMSQQYVLEVPGMYPKRMVFEVFGEDRIKNFNLQQGQEDVTVCFEIDAHEYNGRWFNEVRAFNVKRAGQQPTAQSVAAGL